MSIFENLEKKEFVLVKNVKLSKQLYELVEKVAEKYKAEPGKVVSELVANSKQALLKELNGAVPESRKSKKAE